MARSGRWLELQKYVRFENTGVGAMAGKGARNARPEQAARPTRPVPRYCVLCGTALRAIREHGVPRRACPRCGFIAYRNPVPACGVIVMRGGKVLLAKRAHEPRLGCWGIPAGFMEYGEHPRSHRGPGGSGGDGAPGQAHGALRGLRGAGRPADARGADSVSRAGDGWAARSGGRRERGRQGRPTSPSG